MNNHRYYKKMVIYWFNKKGTNKLFKMYSTEVRDSYHGYYAYLDPKTNPRHEKYIQVPFNEGDIWHRCFWLEEEDDDRAMRIRNEYLNAEINKTIRKLQKMMEVN